MRAAGILLALAVLLAGCTHPSAACVESNPSGATWTDAHLPDAVRSRIANESADSTRTPAQADAVAWPGGGRLTADGDRVQLSGASLPNGTSAVKGAIRLGLESLALPSPGFAAFTLLHAQDACATTNDGY